MLLREFGRCEILVEGKQVRPRIAKTYELLAHLAASPSGRAERDELLHALFDGRDDQSTRAYLRRAVRGLRKVIPRRGQARRRGRRAGIRRGRRARQRVGPLRGGSRGCDPYRETAWRLAMRIASALGDDDRVIRSYRDCQRALERIGASPPATRELLERLRR